LFIRLSAAFMNERSFKILSKKGSYNNLYEVQYLPAIYDRKQARMAAFVLATVTHGRPRSIMVS